MRVAPAKRGWTVKFMNIFLHKRQAANLGDNGCEFDTRIKFGVNAEVHRLGKLNYSRTPKF